MDSKLLKLGGWLNLTDQQFQILVALHQLELRKEIPSPQNIVGEYKLISNKLIQKPNLFTILKSLSGKKLIKKTGQGEYAVNFDGVHNILVDEKEEKQKDLKQLELVVAETEDYFMRQLMPTEQPRVEYLDHDVLFKTLAESLASSTSFYIVGNFPSIAYTYPVYAGLGRDKYLETILAKTLKEKTLTVYFITDLDVDYVFNHAFMTLGDPAKAYHECRLMLKQLRNLVELSENIDVRFHEDPHGLDVAIPVKRKDEPTEFIIFTRDEHKNVMGGVHVKAVEPAKAAKHMFNRLFQYAEKLRGAQAEKRIGEAEERLTIKYGVLEK